MNIESSKTNLSESSKSQSTAAKTQTQTSSQTNQNSSVKFSDELNEMKKSESKNKAEEDNKNLKPENITKEETNLNHLYDKTQILVKDTLQSDENINMIKNDFSIPEPNEMSQMMNPNTNFAGNGNFFSSFMNNQNNKEDTLSSSIKDLSEEAAILSTMAENMAMIKQNELKNPVNLKPNFESTNNDNTVKYDAIIMTQADVEVFANLVNNTELNLNDLTADSIEKSSKISKTLADMLIKAKDNNQPLRIDFDNNISVIIKISREGKISADFLPSSQVAEAYLKENLPLLRQRFDDNNIEYEQLNQRERREQQKNEHNRKKGERDE